MLAGELEPAAMITDVVTLEQLPAAFEALREPIDQCKVLVDLRGD
jgi:(R,R)-butanediol dehydrogenase/meso-butanediol dehydrogenase/diacetyl reductase